MIRDEVGAERPISQTIIDTECDAIFLDVIQEELFQDYAIEHLGQKAHPDTRSHYLDLLRANGGEETASRIEGAISTQEKESLKVFAVDDSKMVLNIYRSVLHNMGCDPVLFEFPAEAISQAQGQKPDVVFTDLNMPEINGVELTKALRQWFPKEQLPIIMVTTQNECQDNDAAYSAGITDILQKPFNEQTLKAALEKHL
jgi:CheY-like chemotaxis protein